MLSPSRFSGSHGFVNAKILNYDQSADQYEIEINNAMLLCLNQDKSLIRLKISSEHVNRFLPAADIHDAHKSIAGSSIATSNSSFADTQNMNDSEIDHVLDEILETDTPELVDPKPDSDSDHESESHHQLESSDSCHSENDGAHHGPQENQYLLSLKQQLELIVPYYFPSK